MEVGALRESPSLSFAHGDVQSSLVGNKSCLPMASSQDWDEKCILYKHRYRKLNQGFLSLYRQERL